MNDSDTVELELYTYSSTPDAFLVGEDSNEPRDPKEKHWLARRIVRDRGEPDRTGCRTYTVPEWWAIEKGLV